MAHGWSRAALQVQIETRPYEGEGRAPSNFAEKLPPSRSDLAQQALKDPYVFDFFALGHEVHERDLEEGLVAHVQRLLLGRNIAVVRVGACDTQNPIDRRAPSHDPPIQHRRTVQA